MADSLGKGPGLPRSRLESEHSFPKLLSKETGQGASRASVSQSGLKHR